MEKKVFIVILFLVILFAGYYYYLSLINKYPEKNKAVKLVLNQTKNYKLFVKSLEVEKAKFSDYKLEIPFAYYNIHIIDNTKKIIFSGKVAKDKVSFPPYEILPEGEEPSTSATSTEPLSEITVFLPHYPKARKIVFLDEANLEKLVVNLKLTR